MKKLDELNYPKQYILLENNNTDIYKSPNEKNVVSIVDEYMFNIVSTVNEQIIEDEKFYLIQHDDKKVGWIKLKDSIQIFRFKPLSGKFIDENFEVNEINNKIGLNKDFRAHFSNKILKFKSEIEYKGKRLVGVFVKDKFFGFHPPESFDFLTRCNIDLTPEDIENKDLYKFSNLKKPIEEEIVIEKPKIVYFLKKSNSARLKVNSKDYYWIKLDYLKNKIENVESYSLINKAHDEKLIDDIFYSIEVERNKSKELVKSVLSAKKYIQSKKEREKEIKMSHLKSSFLNAKSKRDEYSEIIKEIKKENYQLIEQNKVLKLKVNENQILKMREDMKEISDELKLSKKRLEHQKDYNKRLEEQKARYKNRMNELESKMKKLIEKKDK